MDTEVVDTMAAVGEEEVDMMIAAMPTTARPVTAVVGTVAVDGIRLPFTPLLYAPMIPVHIY